MRARRADFRAHIEDDVTRSEHAAAYGQRDLRLALANKLELHGPSQLIMPAWERAPHHLEAAMAVGQWLWNGPAGLALLARCFA